MSSLNKAMIIGNLTRDPEVRTTTTGQAVANFGVATNHSWTDQNGQKQEKAEFHNVVVWGKLAEICRQYLFKGKKVYIDGRLQTREWQGQDGVKRYKTEIIADTMIMLDRGQQASTQAQPAAGIYTEKEMAPQNTTYDMPPVSASAAVSEEVPF